MLFFFTGLAIILAFLLFDNNEKNKTEKLIHQKELDRLNYLRSNQKVNQNYERVIDMCSEIINVFPGSKLENQFKINIYTESTSYIKCVGYLYNDIYLYSTWFFTESDILNIHIRLEYLNKQNKHIKIIEQIEFKDIKNKNHIISSFLYITKDSIK